MGISDQLRCLFPVTIEEREAPYVVEVPEQELRLGNVQEGETHRSAVLSSRSTSAASDTNTKPERKRGLLEPPAEKGKRRTVDNKDIGDQGDGITRVERGFAIIFLTLNKASVLPLRLLTSEKTLPLLRLSSVWVTTTSTFLL